MKQVEALHYADRFAKSLRRVGLGKVTRAGRSLVGHSVARTLTVEVDEFRLSGDIRHRGHLHRVALRDYERLNRALFRDSIRPGMVVLDIGAHLGLYSLIAGSQTGREGKVYAFEPDPRTFPRLVQNVAANGLNDQVAPIDKAVSASTGEELFLLDDSNLAKSGLVTGKATSQAVLMSCVTIDDFVPESQPVDVVKIDIEGGELRALRGMARTLAGGPATLRLFVEVHPRPLQALGSSGEAVLSELEGMGLHAQVVDERRGVLRPLAADDLDGDRGVHLFFTRA